MPNKSNTKIVTAKVDEHKLSTVVKPQDMSLEEWQVALRHQAAEKEVFNIVENVDNEETGYYSVYNPRSKNLYKVIYRGEESRWNFCACLDFKSNCLGTCKHIEAVKLWLASNNRLPNPTLPAYTSVYLSYRHGRTISIRFGADNRLDFERLAASYFDANNELLPARLDSFSTFLAEARQISNTFRCYPDVLQYIIEYRDKQRRSQLVAEHCDDKELNSLLHIDLYPYQREGIRFAIAAGKSIIADEMGLGKTVQAIGAAEVFRKEGFVSSVLIICPTSLKYQWKREIEKVCDTEVVIVEGNQLQRKNHYSSPEFYKIVSYNSASNDIKLYGSLRADMVIMDEAQRLKNWNTQIAKALRRIDSTYTIILSGTPLENKLQELYSIVQFVDQYCLGPFYKFMDFTTITSPENGQIVGYKNLNAVGEMLAHVMIRRTKKEVELQLPRRSDKNLFVPMTREQRMIHDDFHNAVAQIVAKWQHTQFLNEIDRKRLLLLLSQMRMVCDSTFVLDERSRHDTKIEELINIVKELTESGNEKLVVYSQWERMTRLVCMELDRLNIGYAYLNGSVPSEKRKELIERFTEDDACRVFVSTDAGSTGLNLQSASVMVNLDVPWNPALLEQRIGRIYRIGQHRNVQIINFVSERTIEERMLSTLDLKSNIAHGVLDSGADNVFLDDKRFNLLMDSLDCIVSAEKTNKAVVITEECEQAKPAVPVQTTIDFGLDDLEEVGNGSTVSVDLPKVEHKVELEKSAQDMLQQGVSFISRLSETMTSPEKMDALLDTIIKVDKDTGKTKLEIPVPDKKTVEQMLRLLSKLLLK